MIGTKLNLVCPGCTAVNRVPKSRLIDDPVCGKCKQLLAPRHPVELKDGNFQIFIARTGVPVVVDFWAPWCAPCRAMAPAFAAAAAELSPHIMLAKLNTDEARLAARPFEIQGIPCLLAFRNGKEIARQAGALSTSQIIQWVNSWQQQKT